VTFAVTVFTDEEEAVSKRFMRFGRQPQQQQQQQQLLDDDVHIREPATVAKRFMRFGREFMRFGRDRKQRECNLGEGDC